MKQQAIMMSMMMPMCMCRMSMLRCALKLTLTGSNRISGITADNEEAASER